MSKKQKWTEDNGDRTSLKVTSYTNQKGSHAIVVEEYNAKGEKTGYVTDVSNKNSVHVHKGNSEHWEAGSNPETGKPNPIPINYEDENGNIQTDIINP
jgi:hypothetical protein